MKQLGILAFSFIVASLLLCGCNTNTPVKDGKNEFYDYIELGKRTTINEVVLTYLVVSVDSFDYSECMHSGFYPFPMISSVYDSISEGSRNRNNSVDLLPFMLINHHKFNSTTPLFEIWDAFVYERDYFPKGTNIGLNYIQKGVDRNHLICTLENNYYKRNGLNNYPVDSLQVNRNKVKIICTGDTLGLAEIESDFRARQIETFIIPYYMILVTFHHREEFRQPLLDVLEKYSSRYPQARKLLNEYAK